MLVVLTCILFKYLVCDFSALSVMIRSVSWRTLMLSWLIIRFKIGDFRKLILYENNDIEKKTKTILSRHCQIISSFVSFVWMKINASGKQGGCWLLDFWSSNQTRLQIL